ncbi:MAG: hypothetical protein HYY58_04660 [Candidatus Omnitrophica bacterium]|nr:hypothetical protein [Candidatus Omnitrophota bacterium]
MSVPVRPRGLTLVELMIGGTLLTVAIVALLRAFLGQLTVDEHARNRAWAVNDARQVLEELRRQNSGSDCATPSGNPPAGFSSWDAWLADATANGGGGKSVQPNPSANELIVITTSGADPLQITVAACWRERNRTVGECTWNGATLAPNPGAGGNPAVTESPAMLSTAMTCRR